MIKKPVESQSFAQRVKNELARMGPERQCCRAAELVALIRMNGTLVIGGGTRLGLNMATENAAVARKVFHILKNELLLHTEIMVRKNSRLRKQNTYMLKVLPSSGTAKTLKELGIISLRTFYAMSDRMLLRRLCCRRTYLRGAFLGGGSVNKPVGDYHLELVTESEAFARGLSRIMRSLDLNPGLARRKQDCVVYLKGAEDISSFLSQIGAHQALLDFENVRVVKDMRNKVNRLVNCETANLDKTAKAVVRLTDKIKLIEKCGRFSHLSMGLRTVAEARLQHPEASIRELAALIGDGISRSGLQHRLKKLEQIADELEPKKQHDEQG